MQVTDNRTPPERGSALDLGELGRIAVQTIATTCDANAQITVQVQDTGIGIEPQHLERIFEPFFTTKAEGMGIGLSISRTIITEWGGRLWAAPNARDGTTLSFTLPTSASLQQV